MPELQQEELISLKEGRKECHHRRDTENALLSYGKMIDCGDNLKVVEKQFLYVLLLLVYVDVYM